MSEPEYRTPSSMAEADAAWKAEILEFESVASQWIRDTPHHSSHPPSKYDFPVERYRIKQDPTTRWWV